MITQTATAPPRGQISTVDATVTAWRNLARLANKTPIYATALQIQHHPQLSVTQDVIGYELLRSVGIDTMGDLYLKGQFVTLQDLTYISNQTPLFQFTYYRLQKAIRQLYPNYPTEPRQLQALQMIIQSPNKTHLVSRLYAQMQDDIDMHNVKAKQRWDKSLASQLTDEEWTICCTVTGMITPNGNLRILHLKYIHQTYYTPMRLFKFGLRTDASCIRCHNDRADFVHLAWACDPIRRYWENVVRILNTMIQTSIQCTIQTCVLGVVRDIRALKRKYCLIALLVAKRRISLVWGSKAIPTIEQWVKGLTYSRDQLHIYVDELPVRSKPKDYWIYLTDYLKDNPVM